MSLPSTGRVVVRLAAGEECVFDGRVWTGNEVAPVRLLNTVLEMVPRHHYGVEDVARACLDQSGLAKGAEVLSVKQDVWRSRIDGVD